MATRIQVRRDYAYKWLQVNPILAEGEVGFVIDTNRLKIGDGLHHWNDLPYLSPDSSEAIDIMKQLEDYTYDKSTIEKKFIDNQEMISYMNSKEGEILNTVEQKYYTKDESNATFVKGYELDNVSKELNNKIDKLDKTKANAIEVYTKSTIDNMLNTKQDTLTSENSGENVYITTEGGKPKINVSFSNAPGKDIEFESTDTIEVEQVVETDRVKKVKIYVKNPESFVHKSDLDNYYTKDEVYYSVQTLSNKVDENANKVNADIERINTLKADKTLLANYATKEELDKAVIGEYGLDNYYTKTEVDNKIAEIDVSEQLKDYATKEDLNNVAQVSFENSDTVEFTKNNNVVSARVINVYTKTDIDATVATLATKEEVNNVKDIVISTQSELDKLQEKFDNIDVKKFIQLSESAYGNLEDGCMLIYENGEWNIQQLGIIRTIAD